MRVGIVIDPYGEGKPGGLGRAVFEIAKALIEADSGNAYTVFLKRTPERPLPIPGTYAVSPLNVRSIAFASARAFGAPLDLYLFLTPAIPLGFFPKRSVVVAHDFAYLALPARTLRQWVGARAVYLLHLLSFLKATRIVAVSEATKRELIRHFGIRPEKITVIHNGFIALPQEPEPLSVPERFFLFAGVLKERKNVAGVIRAFASFAKTHPDFNLLIAGKQGSAYADSLVRLAKECSLEDRVRFLGYVSDEQLTFLYRNAEALVFPSFVEGFGMPVLEAMQEGLPVVTSNTGALAEVAGDAAILVDPNDPEAIARGMEAALSEREELIKKGRGRAASFSWQRCSAEFRAVLAALA